MKSKYPVSAVCLCTGNDQQRAPQTSPPRKLASAAPFDLRRIAAVVPTERERVAFVRSVGGGGGSCPAQPPTGLNRALLGY